MQDYAHDKLPRSIQNTYNIKYTGRQTRQAQMLFITKTKFTCYSSVIPLR
jgi:hypothetical protein